MKKMTKQERIEAKALLEELGLEEDEAEVELEDYEIDNAIYQAVSNGVFAVANGAGA